jgi:hypothetical protein
MVTGLINAFIQAKMRNPETSIALYAVSSDLDAAKIAEQMGVRSNKAIVRMLESASEPLATDPKLAAFILQGAMVGVSRRMLESGAREHQVDALRKELTLMASAYLDACSAQASVQDTGILKAAPFN